MMQYGRIESCTVAVYGIPVIEGRKNLERKENVLKTNHSRADHLRKVLL